MLLRHYLIATVLVSLAVLGTYYLYRHATCANENYTTICFLERTEGVIRHHGAKAAFPYLTDIVLPRAGYATSHFVMHSVGEHAYIEEDDVFKTLAYLEPYEAYTSEPEFLGGFDGFVHGAVTSYFSDVADGSSQAERMRYLCEGSNVKNITTNTRGCYHSIGHALMYANGNKVDDAVRICDEASTDAAKRGCYYGVFMEDSFLFWPEYHPGIPRPDAQGSSLIPVCDRFSSSTARECHRFVGQTEITIRYAKNQHLGPEDMIEATKQCDLLKENRDLCLSRLAALFLPPYVQGTASEEDVCATAFPPEHQTICLEALKDGLRRRFGISDRPRSSIMIRALTLFRAAVF